MAWFILILAGITEIAWAIGLKYSDGFSKPLISITTVIFLLTSVGLLGWSLKALPLGLAYSVWVGIGVMGTSVIGIVLLGETINSAKLLCLALILTGIVGLKLAS